MDILDLTCRESASLADGAKSPAYAKDRLYLGAGFKTYLFFKLPSTDFFSKIVKAKLILFKIPFPLMGSCPPSHPGQYGIFPLLDYFSAYSGWYAPPRFDAGLRVDYQDQDDLSYAEIDITKIVSSWIETDEENKGLLLSGAPDTRFLIFASGRYETVGMRPTLRLAGRGFSRPLSMAPCTVRIKR